MQICPVSNVLLSIMMACHVMHPHYNPTATAIVFLALELTSSSSLFFIFFLRRRRLHILIIVSNLAHLRTRQMNSINELDFQIDTVSFFWYPLVSIHSGDLKPWVLCHHRFSTPTNFVWLKFLLSPEYIINRSITICKYIYKDGLQRLKYLEDSSDIFFNFCRYLPTPTVIDSHALLKYHWTMQQNHKNIKSI